MYAFCLKVKVKPDFKSKLGLPFTERIRAHYFHKSASVTRELEDNYNVRFSSVDHYFPVWCFDLPQYLELSSIEITIPGVLLPRAERGLQFEPGAEGWFQAFLVPAQLSEVSCMIKVNKRERSVMVRLVVSPLYDLDEQHEFFEVTIEEVLKIAKLTKAVIRVLQAHRSAPQKTGFNNRAVSKLFQTIASSYTNIILVQKEF